MMVPADSPYPDLAGQNILAKYADRHILVGDMIAASKMTVLSRMAAGNRLVAESIVAGVLDTSMAVLRSE